jgi:hypothetical protein
MLYPQGRLREALNAQPEIRARVFETPKQIDPSELVSEGRVDGGGLHKVELEEYAQIPARVRPESIDTHLCTEQEERLFARSPELRIAECPRRCKTASFLPVW